MRKLKREADTFLTHLLSRGLADERYEVKRYKSADGDIRPVAPAETDKSKKKRVTASRRAVRERMRKRRRE